MSMVIRSLTGTPPETLYAGFSRAFANYERTWTEEEFFRTLKRNGFSPENSYGAFDGDQLVSFLFNAIGSYNQKLTAYDTGTGTIPEYAGQGLATRLFAHVEPLMKEKGVQQYVLEVLQKNVTAISIYKKAGFKAAREIDYFIHETALLLPSQKSLPEGYLVKESTLADVFLLQHEMDRPASWQNSLASLERAVRHFTVISVYDHSEKTIGCSVIDPVTGDVPFLVVKKDNRHKGIASVLLHRVARQSRSGAVRFINVDRDCESMQNFLAKQGIFKKGSQFEMVKEI